MTGSADLQSLRTVLEELLACSRALSTTLIQEREALTEHNLSSLNQHTETKKDQLVRLEALELQRRQLLKHMGFDPMTDVIVPGLEGLWQEVLTALRTCQEDNEVNGAIVRTHQTQTQRALDLLAGRDTRQDVYAADGLPTSRLRSDEIAKA